MESVQQTQSNTGPLKLKRPLWADQNSFSVKVLRPSDFIHLMRNINIRVTPAYIRKRYSTKDFQRWIPAFYFTGMRYPELWYLQRNEKWYNSDDGSIFLPRGYTKTRKPRTVYLSDAGRKIMEGFFDSSWLPGDADPQGNLTPKERQRANVLIGQALSSFAEYAGFPKMEFGKKRIKHPVLDHEGNRVKDEHGRYKYNVEERNLITDGLSFRSFRCSWETLAVKLHPDKIEWIALSQGHDGTTQLRHYLNQGFDQGDLEDGRPLVAGYMR